MLAIKKFCTHLYGTHWFSDTSEDVSSVLRVVTILLQLISVLEDGGSSESATGRFK